MELTATDYILLAYLNANAVHTYRLAEILALDRVDCWSRFSVPHLYYSLRRLKQQGLVEIELKKGKSRPPQKVYSLTAEGRRLLKNLTASDQLLFEDHYFAFDLFWGLADKLEFDKKQLKNLIEKRVDFLREALSDLQKKFREKEINTENMGVGERLAFQHRIRFLKNEIDFYRKSLKELK